MIILYNFADPMTTNNSDCITIVTAPDFSPPTGGTVLVVLGSEGFDPSPIKEEIIRQWPIDDALVVYLQEVTCGSDFTRSIALCSSANSTIIVGDEHNPLLTLLGAKFAYESGVIISSGISKEFANAMSYSGINVADSADQAVKSVIDPN